jgi:hypothetical protein
MPSPAPPLSRSSTFRSFISLSEAYPREFCTQGLRFVIRGGLLVRGGLRRVWRAPGCRSEGVSGVSGVSMRRVWVMCAVLVLVAAWGTGCSGPPAPDQGEVKQAFVRQLVGFCAEVDRQLAKIDVKGQPGKAADQLARFVGQARNQPAPEVDRAQFEILLTEMDGTVQHFRTAQSALSVGDHAAYQKEFDLAKQELASADAAAQKYGMPPLDSCPQHESPGSAPAPGPTAGPAPAAAWQLRHAALEAVQQVGAAVLDGRIWVAGGLTMAQEATASTQFYDPTIDAWEAGPPLPEPVHHAALVTYRGQLVLIGGFLGRAGDPLAVTSAQVLFFDEKAGRWVQGPSLRHERGAAAAAVVGDQIVVAGGRTGHPEQLVAQTEVFDGTGWRDAADISLPGDHLAAATDGMYLYAVGGRKFTAGSNTDAVQRYDPAANQWIAMPAMPTPLSGAGAAVVDGQLLVAGGEHTTSVSSAVLAYDLTAPTASWVALAPLNLGRHGLGVTAVGNTLYAIAGSTRAGHTASTAAIGALPFS